MLKQIARLKVGLVILLGVLFFYSGAFAMVDSRVIDRGDNRGHNSGYDRGDRHYYRDGRWYKHDSRGNEVIVSALGIGVLIEALPPQHTTVVVEGSSYYHDGDHYFRQAPQGGYVVVQPPVIVHPPIIVQPQSRSNDNGRGDRGDNSHNEGNRGQNH